MQQRGLRAAAANGLNGADDDRVRMPLDDFFQSAIETRNRIGEHGRARDQCEPVARLESRGAADAAASGKARRERFVASGKQIDREGPVFAQMSERRGAAIDRYQQRWRRQRKRGQRSDRATRSPLGLAASDDGDAGGEFAHRQTKAIARRRWRERRGIVIQRAFET